ncbi:MAG: twin-arginine translocation pathway signal, partial [Cyanobacteriota bacterium]
NGSRGTDHGSASAALLFDEQLLSRLIGNYPSLNNLDDRGDMITSLSPHALFRQVLQLAVV